MDIFSTAKRSEIMSLIKSAGTLPEKRIYRIARRILGKHVRISRNPKRVIGTPDLYIPSFRLVVFLDGCFFHGCPIHGHIPKSNVAYWEKKIARNKMRDRKNRRTLRQQGFSVWRFWEHELKPRREGRVARRLERAIDQQRRRLNSV